MEEIIIGDKNTFAIRYIPGYKYKSENGNYYLEFAIIHLVLGGQIIGNAEEICLAGTWIHHLKYLRDRILHKTEFLSTPAFANRSDKEIFELLIKANQLEDDYKPSYDYLPVLDHSIWVACIISMDETTDAWTIFVIEDKGELKFLWKGWRSPCLKERLKKLFSVTVGKNFVIQTMEAFLERVENDLPNYPVKN